MTLNVKFRPLKKEDAETVARLSMAATTSTPSEQSLEYRKGEYLQESMIRPDNVYVMVVGHQVVGFTEYENKYAKEKKRRFFLENDLGRPDVVKLDKQLKNHLAGMVELKPVEQKEYVPAMSARTLAQQARWSKRKL